MTKPKNRKIVNNTARAWEQKNRAKRREKDQRMRAKRLQAVPNWLTKKHKQIMQWYHKEADRLTEETGIKHHVDHIVPLRGKDVRGLHVPWNLQVISGKENAIKGNRWYPEQDISCYI